MLPNAVSIINPGLDVNIITVDDVEFPWHIAEAGLHIRRLDDDLYGIHVELICAKQDRRGGFYQRDMYSPPQFGGIEFPWTISSEGFRYVCKPGKMPVLSLEFLAAHVATNLAVSDERATDLRPNMHSLEHQYAYASDRMMESKITA